MLYYEQSNEHPEYFGLIDLIKIARMITGCGLMDGKYLALRFLEACSIGLDGETGRYPMGAANIVAYTKFLTMFSSGAWEIRSIGGGMNEIVYAKPNSVDDKAIAEL